MIFPLTTSTIVSARLYAIESLNHTFSYGGWQSQDKSAKQAQRICTGVFGQTWVSEFCRLNSIQYELDSSAATQSDSFDLTISGIKTDVKTTVLEESLCQVNAALKNKPIDWFIFLRTDLQYSFVEPLGIIDKSSFFRDAEFVAHNELIPGTRSLRNRFHNGSFFLDPKKLSPFVQTLEKLRNLN